MVMPTFRPHTKMNNTSASAGMTGTRMLRKGLLRRDLCSPHQIEAEPNGGGGTALVTSLPSHTLTFYRLWPRRIRNRHGCGESAIDPVRYIGRLCRALIHELYHGMIGSSGFGINPNLRNPQSNANSNATRRNGCPNASMRSLSSWTMKTIRSAWIER